MFDELADAQDLAGRAELLLDGVERIDGRLRPVRAVQVPRVEAGEVLQGTEDLVSANFDTAQLVLYNWAVVGDGPEHTGCRDEAQIVRHRRVVDEGVTNHIGFFYNWTR